MTRDELECWWWWKKNPPTRLDEWPAYRYEVASRATDKKSTTKEPQQPHYLLGKPYPDLTLEQKKLVRRIFGRGRVKREHDWRTIRMIIDLRWSNRKIVKALMDYVRAERRRAGLPESRSKKEATTWANKGDAHRKREAPFRHIQALDQWRNLEDRTEYDLQGGQQSRAATKARKLRQEWHDKRKAIRQADRETARRQVIIGKLQRGKISAVEAAHKLGRIGR